MVTDGVNYKLPDRVPVGECLINYIRVFGRSQACLLTDISVQSEDTGAQSNKAVYFCTIVDKRAFVSVVPHQDECNKTPLRFIMTQKTGR